jgi:molecular chaperone DnaJ
MPTDAYELLGVSRDADDTQIKKAFRKLARELHPDVNQAADAEERFKQVAEAYEILSDSERRATYDRYGYEGLKGGGYQPSDFGSFGGLSDILDAFFGGGGGVFGGGRRGPAQGGDVAAQVDIDLADVVHGTSTELTYEVVERCSRCNGNAAEPGTPIRTCDRCGGQGMLQGVSRTPFGNVMRTVECDVCHGDGRIPEQPCTRCEGRGRTLEERRPVRPGPRPRRRALRARRRRPRDRARRGGAVRGARPDLRGRDHRRHRGARGPGRHAAR